MDENEFFVAIQGVMTRAHESGWSVDKVYEKTTEASEEWLDEMQNVSSDVNEGK